MYCKHCGKQITEDSKFCQHCGNKIEAETPETIIQKESGIPFQSDNKTTSKIEEQNQPKDPIVLKVEVQEKSKKTSSIIANEIIGNIKMIGVTISLVVVYMLGFILIHQKDIKKYDYETHTSYWGESCYDEDIITGYPAGLALSFERVYYEELHYNMYRIRAQYFLGTPTPEEFLKKIESLEKELDKKNKEYQRKHGNSDGIRSVEEIKQRAKEKVAENREEWNFYINSNRKYSYQEDLKNNAIYSTLICLALTIGGRYLIKLVRWINENRN